MARPTGSGPGHSTCPSAGTGAPGGPSAWRAERSVGTRATEPRACGGASPGPLAATREAERLFGEPQRPAAHARGLRDQVSGLALLRLGVGPVPVDGVRPAPCVRADDVGELPTLEVVTRA